MASILKGHKDICVYKIWIEEKHFYINQMLIWCWMLINANIHSYCLMSYPPKTVFWQQYLAFFGDIASADFKPSLKYWHLTLLYYWLTFVKIWFLDHETMYFSYLKNFLTFYVNINPLYFIEISIFAFWFTSLQM